MMYTITKRSQTAKAFCSPRYLLNIFVVVGVLLASLPSANVCIALPLDGEAAESIKTLRELVQQPSNTRKLSVADTERYIRLAKEDNQDRQIVAVLTLAFADDDLSSSLLKELSTTEKDKSSLLSGAAQYAVALRSAQTVKKNESEVFIKLSDYLEKTENSATKMFLANRLFVDYGSKSLPVILAAFEEEKNKFVKLDMLYYLAQSNDPAVEKRVLAQNWDEIIELPEDFIFLMSSITPGRGTGFIDNSTIMLIRKIREKLD